MWESVGVAPGELGRPCGGGRVAALLLAFDLGGSGVVWSRRAKKSALLGGSPLCQGETDRVACCATIVPNF